MGSAPGPDFAKVPELYTWYYVYIFSPISLWKAGVMGQKKLSIYNYILMSVVDTWYPPPSSYTDSVQYL